MTARKSKRRRGLRYERIGQEADNLGDGLPYNRFAFHSLGDVYLVSVSVSEKEAVNEQLAEPLQAVCYEPDQPTGNAGYDRK